MCCLILNYHNIYSEQKSKQSKYCISADEFRWQIDQLCQSNLKNILPKELYSSDGETFVLTFDDGYESDFKFVAEVLKLYGLKAVFFILTESDALIKHSKNYKELIKNGHQVAAHGTNHKSLKLKMKNELLDEFETCKTKLETALDTEIEDFSLPYGQFNSNTFTSAYARGFKRVYGTKFGMYQKGHSANIIPRWTITDKISRTTFKNVILKDPYTIQKLKTESSLKKIITNHVNSKQIYKIQNILQSCF